MESRLFWKGGVPDLVLQAVPAALQVHLFCVWVVEAALAQFAVEADDFPFVVAHLEETPPG